MLLAGVAWVGGRTILSLRNAVVPAPVKAHIGLAFLNVVVAGSLGFLIAAAGLGLALVIAPPAAWKTGATAVYGVFALVGFLSQMVVGMQARLLPLFAWLHANARSGHTVLPPSPYAMPERRLQQAVLALWMVGVPGLAFALYSADPVWLRGAAGVMLAAVLVKAVNDVRVVRRAFPTRGH